MSGDPAVMKKFDAKRALQAGRRPGRHQRPRLHTLDAAAKLIGKPVGAVRDDAAAEHPGAAPRCSPSTSARPPARCRGRGRTGTRRWPATARPPTPRAPSCSPSASSTRCASGESSVTTGRPAASRCPPTAPVKPRQAVDEPRRLPLARHVRASRGGRPSGARECPLRPRLRLQAGATRDNYNVANRPDRRLRHPARSSSTTPRATTTAAVERLQEPDEQYASAHYIDSSDDGSLVTQLVATKDESYHAGNKTVNMHSLGIEHVGFAMKAGSWYGEPLYDSSATLVKYLAGGSTSRWTASTSSATTRCRVRWTRTSPGSTGTRARSGTGTTTCPCSAPRPAPGARASRSRPAGRQGRAAVQRPDHDVPWTPTPRSAPRQRSRSTSATCTRPRRPAATR